MIPEPYTSVRARKQKGHRKVAFLFVGGGGGNRTRVRKPYTYGSTCVVCLLCDAPPSGRQGDGALSLLEFNVSPTGTD